MVFNNLIFAGIVGGITFHGALFFFFLTNAENGNGAYACPETHRRRFAIISWIADISITEHSRPSP